MGSDLFSPSVVHLIRPMWEKRCSEEEKKKSYTDFVSIYSHGHGLNPVSPGWQRKLLLKSSLGHRIHVNQLLRSLSFCRPNHIQASAPYPHLPLSAPQKNKKKNHRLSLGTSFFTCQVLTCGCTCPAPIHPQSLASTIWPHDEGRAKSVVAKGGTIVCIFAVFFLSPAISSFFQIVSNIRSL